MNKRIKMLIGTVLVASTMLACQSDVSDENHSFIGCWKYEGFEYYIVLEEDLTWKMIYENGDIDALGEVRLENDCAYLYEQGEYDYEEGTFEDGEEFLQLSFLEDGKLSASNGFNLYATEEPDWGNDDTVQDFIGCWQYNDFDLYLMIEEDMTWRIQTKDETIKGTGIFVLENGYVQLHETGGYIYEASEEITDENMFLKLYLKEDGMMQDSGSRTLVFIEEP